MRNLLALLLIGLVVYTIISLVLRTRPGPAGPARGFGRKPKPSGPVAPDDDPEFLWKLDQQQRQADRDAKPGDAADGDAKDQDQPGPRGTTP